MRMRSRPTFFLATTTLLLVCLMLALPTKASITIVDSGETIVSRPDKKLGKRLWKGYEYIGRLQYVPGNRQLCPQPGVETFHVTAPSDGLPVALYAKAGGCSVEEKALVASTMIDPPGIVSYLIIDDEGKKRKRSFNNNNNNNEEEEDGLLLWDPIPTPPQVEEQPVKLISQDDATDDESVPLHFTVQTSEGKVSFLLPAAASAAAAAADDATDDEPAPLMSSFQEDDSLPSRNLRHSNNNNNNNINVVILHVDYKAGYTLLGVILKESSETRKHGGSKILVNDKEPPATAQQIFLWTLFSMSICCAACCCLALCVNINGLEEEQPPPRRPVRRRLTHQQVRDNYPVFRFHDDNNDDTQNNNNCSEEECAICLDEYTPGVRCRQLPCNHTFHSTCIARWMIERSATCPLCKIDLYEEEEEEEESDSESAQEASPPSTQPLLSWWNDMVTRSRDAVIVDPPTTNNNNNGNSAAAAAATTTTNVTTAQQQQQQQQQPSRSSWWPLASSNNNISGEDTESSSPRGFWRSNWFGRQRRRPILGGIRQTELTEPLISGEQQREEGQEQESPAEETAAATPSEQAQEEETPTEPSSPEDPPQQQQQQQQLVEV